MKKYSLSYYKAIQFAAEELGLSKRGVQKPVEVIKEIPKITNSITVLGAEIKEYSQEEINWWKQYGITTDILKKFNVFSVKTVFLNGRIVSTANSNRFIFGYYLGCKEETEIWKIYFPLENKHSSYRFLTNGKDSVIQGWRQLPKNGEFVVITKSMKDLMLYYKFGIPAIAPNSENVFLSENKLNDLVSRFNNIVVHFDNDQAGINAMRKLKKKYPFFTYTFIPRGDSKDLSDYYKEHGEEKTLELINNFIEKNK